jgi:ferredoxin
MKTSFFQVNDKCTGCLACVQNCPARALDYRDEGDNRTLLHNMARCARCATCLRVCPEQAVEFEHILENRWDEVVSLKMVRCEVCGNPLHSFRLDANLASEFAEITTRLCPRHRAAHQGRAGRPGGQTREEERKPTR